MTKVRGMIPGGPGASHTHPGSGLQVIIRSIRGVTHPDLLQRPYHFQCAPLEEFGWDAAATWNDYLTVRGGTFSRPGGRELRQVPVSSIVVDSNPNWAVYAGGNHHNPDVEPGGNAPDPARVAWELDALLSKMSPFRLVVWNIGLSPTADLNLPVTMRTLSVRERVGELDARYFDMSFSEYRRPKLRHRGYGGTTKRDLPAKVRVDHDGVAQEIRNGEERDKIGTPKDPCTMRKLSLFYYGESSMWRVLAAYNGVPQFGGDEPFTHLDRNGRKYRSLQIPRKDSFRADISKGRKAEP